jgi:predicted dehydrogenase
VGGYDSDPTPFFRSTAGPLADMAVYPLHALSGLLGPVNAVAAMSSRARDRFTIETGPLRGKTVAIETDDEWELLLRLEGCIASVNANFATVESPAPECELRGDRGAIAFSLLDVSAPVRVWRADRGGWTDVDVPHARAKGPTTSSASSTSSTASWTDASPVASAAHAVHVLEVLDAARASAADGRIIAMGEAA